MATCSGAVGRTLARQGAGWQRRIACCATVRSAAPPILRGFSQVRGGGEGMRSISSPRLRVRHASGATGAEVSGSPLDFLLCPARVHDVFNPRVGMGEGGEPSWVSDIGQQLPAAQRDELDRLCDSLHSAWCAEVAVVVLDGLPEDVNPPGFAAALMNYWGIGDCRLHTGVIVLLLNRQRRLVMRVGHGAARVLGPEVRQAIQDEHMIPHFRGGQPGAGLCAGLQQVISTFEDKCPPRWRRDPAAPKPELNRHGFGGGQTPFDEFMPEQGSAPATSK